MYQTQLNNDFALSNQSNKSTQLFGGNAQMQLSNEFAQLIVTKNIVEYMKTQIIKKNQHNPLYELMNCIERLLLYLANINIDFEREYNVPQKFKIYPSFIIFKRNNKTPEDSQNLKKLKYGFLLFADELMKKGLINRENMKKILAGIISIIKQGLRSDIQYPGKVLYSSPNLIFVSKNSRISVNIRNFRNIEQLAHTQKEDAMILAMRYVSFITGGNHWSLPSKYFNYLYLKCGVRNEGFASIINTKALQYHDTKFCSLFPDIEGKYGSLGSFFHNKLYDHPGNWAVNPPYTEYLIKTTITKVLSDLRENEQSQKTSGTAVFLMLPNWSDCLTELKGSEYLLKYTILKPGEMYFEMQDQSPYFILSEQFYSVVYNKIGADKKYDNILIDGLLSIRNYRPQKTKTVSNKRILGSIYANTFFEIS